MTAPSLHAAFILGAAHLSPWLTIPVAGAIIAALGYYWHQLGHAGVPPTRKMIRRWSIAFMMLACFDLVVALSFADHAARPQFYVAAWSGVLMLMLLVVVIAFVDLLNSMRLQRREFEHEASRAASELSRILQHHAHNQRSAQSKDSSHEQHDEDRAS